MNNILSKKRTIGGISRTRKSSLRKAQFITENLGETNHIHKRNWQNLSERKILVDIKEQKLVMLRRIEFPVLESCVQKQQA